MRILLSFILIFISLVPNLDAADPPHRVLFIGNSYTAQIRSTLETFVKSSPHRQTHFEFITPGGKNLLFHADQKNTVERIRQGRWDIVVLQDQSQTPAVLPDRFFKGSKKLHEIIAKSGARTAYYQTWGRRDGDKQNNQRIPTYETMQDALDTSYLKAAKRDDAILVPVGRAWRRVREKHPALGTELYRKDGSHPSATGAYLVAICFYVRLFEADPDEVEYAGPVSAEIAQKLRAAAVAAVTSAAKE